MVYWIFTVTSLVRYHCLRLRYRKVKKNLLKVIQLVSENMALENISVRHYKWYSYLLCCIASWLLSHMCIHHYITFSWCQNIKMWFYTIHCQLLNKLSIRKSKPKGVGTLIIWELHHRVGQNRAIYFKNKKDKRMKKSSELKDGRIRQNTRLERKWIGGTLSRNSTMHD